MNPNSRYYRQVKTSPYPSCTYGLRSPHAEASIRKTIEELQSVVQVVKVGCDEYEIDLHRVWEGTFIGQGQIFVVIMKALFSKTLALYRDTM